MSKDPAVLFYTSDFLTGTLTMTYEQKGKYITLLCLQHQKTLLSDKDMISICTSYDKDIYDKFIKDGEFFYNKRMKEEHEKRANFSKSRSDNRLNGLKNKTLKPKKTTSSYDNHMENENENINKNITIDIVKAYFKEKGYSETTAQKFFDYYSVAKWKDSKGKVVKNWKQKAQGVWFKEENKILTNESRHDFLMNAGKM
jgi:uncharacterized protein YdaU (DUF1376 family)